MIVGIILVVGAILWVFLVLFSYQNTNIRTLFGKRAPEHQTLEQKSESGSAPIHPWLNVVFGTSFIAFGAVLLQTGESSLWGAPVHGPSVRAGGLVMILMGIFLSYPSVVSLCRGVFKDD